MYSILKSLGTANWLIAALMGLLLCGAVVMPLSPAFGEINSMALLEWLKTAPLAASWWLWGGMAVLFVLAVNTVVCSIDSVLRKRDGRQWLLTIAPQVIHAGFVLVMIAHLASGYGGFHKYAVLTRGYGVRLDSGVEVYLKDIDYRAERGHMTEMSAEVLCKYPDGGVDLKTLSPNNPSFIDGTGLYLKRVSAGPEPAAVVQFSYDPGAPWALAGGVLFLTGTVTLVVLKLKDRRGKPER